ncbi:TetR/AcrR family transcriptional regulator C-terminal domain-containing protein [Ramlibacter solisilvae]|uniref:TetR/AcrR family transcriptional regulator n=1 Tax=Ramlibacter tataouinensis TaxID=94132 RepID=UPI0007781364|nr:TetR family transcriptional regulator [Ramlibacter tataouinensis]
MVPRKGSTAEFEPLSRERIVQAALETVEHESLAGFSTRKLAARLGCEAMSIYHHFRSKQHLMDALVEHAIGSVDIPMPIGDPAQDEQSLRRMVASYRAMARRWPALFPLVALHRLNTPAGVRFIESLLRLIRAVEPDVERAARQFRAMGYYLIGAGLEETAGYARGPSAAEPVSEEYIQRECPNLVAAAPYFQEEQWDATFWWGVDALVEGARARGAGTSPAQPSRKLRRPPPARS